MGKGRLYLHVSLRSGPGLLNCAVWRVCHLSLSLQQPANETVHSWWPARFCNSLTTTEPSCRRLRSLVLPASFSARHISCNSALWRSCAVASSESTWSYKESQVVIVVTHLWLTCDSPVTCSGLSWSLWKKSWTCLHQLADSGGLWDTQEPWPDSASPPVPNDENPGFARPRQE